MTAGEFITGFNAGRFTVGFGQISESPALQDRAKGFRIRYARHMGGGREAFLEEQTADGPIFKHILLGADGRVEGIEHYSTVEGKPDQPQRFTSYDYEEKQNVKHPLTQEVLPGLTVVTVREYEIDNRTVSKRLSGIARMYVQSSLDEQKNQSATSLQEVPLWYEDYTFRESNYPKEKGKWIESARTFFFDGRCIEYIQVGQSTIHKLDLSQMADWDALKDRGLPTLPEEISLPPYFYDVHSFDFRGN